jgi:hypothetical protein
VILAPDTDGAQRAGLIERRDQLGDQRRDRSIGAAIASGSARWRSPFTAAFQVSTAGSITHDV